MPVYHSVQSSHCSLGAKTLNDKLEQEECPALIDQTLIPSDTPSEMHHFECSLQFEFQECVET
jgi:hypothetical protein